MHVSLQIMSYMEEDLTGTLDAYADQRVPGYVDSIRHQVAITPRESIRSSMIEQAEAHDVFETVRTPPGKLTSRNYAHNLAMKQGADVIVVGDADAPPLHDNVLARILEPFEDGDVSAVNSAPIAEGPTGMIVNVLAAIEDRLRPHAHGQLSAFTADAWDYAGPFDTSLDQTDIHEVRSEEEFDFYRRLNEVGRVAKAPKARVKNDTRRVTCVIQDTGAGEPRDDFCRRRGTTTFSPRDRR